VPPSLPSPCKGEGGAEGAGRGSRLSADSEFVAGPPPGSLRDPTSPLQGKVLLRMRLSREADWHPI